MINTLPSPKTKKSRVQVGRGYGSGKGGHTSGKGTKGQRSRTGYNSPRPGFEGGQMPLSRRLPKLRGFSRGLFKSNVRDFEVKLSDIAKLDADTITVDTLLEYGLIRPTSKKASVKVLFDTEIDKKITLEGIAASKKVIEAIEKAGGEVK
jgi:large subunit ribosomal protein L15